MCVGVNPEDPEFRMVATDLFYVAEYFLLGVQDGPRSTGIMYANDVCMAATPNV